MDNEAMKLTGPGFHADLARMGGDVVAGFTDATLALSGPSWISDAARMGANIVSPTISGTPVDEGQDAVAYEGFTVTASGGSTPYTYALVGTWPTGLEIDDETGAVSGTPTEDGVFTGLSVSATDDAGEVVQIATFTLTIAVAE
jgi:hypothetical protein